VCASVKPGSGTCGRDATLRASAGMAGGLAGRHRSRYIGAMSTGMIQFWLIAGAMALAVAVTMGRALLRRDQSATGNPDLEVYRDQLAEIERDRKRGLLAAAEAEGARAEVARRLLDAERRRKVRSPAGAGPGLGLAAALVVGIVIASATVYWRIGAPGYPDLPLADRLAAADALRLDRPTQAQAETQAEAAEAGMPAGMEPDPALRELMERLRAALADRPDDLEGHLLLAQNEANLGNFAAAARAQTRVITLRGDAASATDHANLAELMVLAAGGYVSPEAEAALAAALATDPRHGPARYYTGLMFAQTGRPDRAFEIWEGLLRDSRPAAPWVPALRAQLPEAAARAGIRYDLPPLPQLETAGEPARGPTAEDIAAADALDPGARTEMVRGMVEGLAQRLASEGGSPDDWARLVSALVVLGEDDRARAILTEARQVFADAPGAVEDIEDAARRAGLTE